MSWEQLVANARERRRERNRRTLLLMQGFAAAQCDGKTFGKIQKQLIAEINEE